MSSNLCIANCVNDTRIPVRATYVNLYKWPESDAEFVKMLAADTTMRRVGEPYHHHHHPHPHPRVVDSVSCRQLYLRSYTFSRKETVPEKTKKCLDKVKERMARGGGRKRKRMARGKRCVVVVVRRLKDLSAAALCGVFRRLLSCSASVDVVDRP